MELCSPLPPSSSSRVSPVRAERPRPVYSPCFRRLLEMAVPWCPNLDFRLGPMPGDATSSDQVLAVRGWSSSQRGDGAALLPIA
jgi:hypothetical protein